MSGDRAPMRVVHACTGNMYGGVEAVVAALARHRDAASGLQQTFASCFEGRLSRELALCGAEASVFGPARLGLPWTVLRARRSLRRLFARVRPEAVVCHGAWTHAVAGPEALRAGARLVHWQHDMAPPGSVRDPARRPRLGPDRRPYWTERRAARVPADLVIANSRATAATAPEMFPDAPVEVLYCPVEPPAPIADPAALRRDVRRELSTPEAATVLAMTCRLAPYKGHRVLLEALALLRDDPAWIAWVAGGVQGPGERPYFDGLVALAESSGIADRVRFLGQRSDVPRLLAAADVHCQPNVGPEPFGIAFVEAMYAGLPVVTTAIGGALEVVTEGTGALVPPGDPAALASALRPLLADPGLRRRLGSAGPARAASLCDPTRHVERLSAILRGEAGRGAAPPRPRASHPAAGAERR